MSLEGHHAVVTGAGSGIGRATAERLAEAGARVTLIGRTAARLSETADRIGDAAFPAPADVTDAEELEAALDAGRDRFGPVDILINNAGAATSAPFLKTDADAWRAMLALNLEAPAAAARLVLPGMLTRQKGRIVNVASTAGLKGYAYVSAYVAAKHGLVGFTKTVALELAEEGVTCNAICPGYVLTPLVESQIADQMKVHGLPRDRVVREVMLQRQPTREFARVKDIGAMTVFLCSDAAAQITGTTLSIDGGWTAL